MKYFTLIDTLTGKKHNLELLTLEKMSDLTVGRQADNDIVLGEGIPKSPITRSVSGVHAILYHVNTPSRHYEIEDTYSTNGTIVNGEPIEPGKKIPLNNGDRIDFGNYITTYQEREGL